MKKILQKIHDKKYIVLFIIYFPSILYSQYSSFDAIPSHPIASGLASSGVGLKDPILNITSNPAFLAGKKMALIDGGLLLPFQGKESSSIKPSNLGGYYPLNHFSGIGFSGKSVLHSAFPDSSKYSLFLGHFFYSIVFSDKYYFSIGLGPGVGLRQREQSNISLSPNISGGVDLGKYTIGFSLQSPGGIYRYKLYRGGDELNERLPPIGQVGLSYNLSKNLQIYSEIRKIFFEKSTFQLNGEESKPNFERGLGAELKTSLGISLTIKEESVFKIRSGIEIGGKYDSKGKNLRGTGLGIGFGYIPNPNGEGFEFNFSILDYSLLSNKNGYPSETLFFCSLGYHFAN